MVATYPSLLATGVGIAGRFDQFDLLAGEDDIVTGQGQVADGVAILQFQMLTFDNDGRLIPWGATGEHATAALTFTGQPTANDTVTVNGVAITFVASGATGAQVNIGTLATDTVANLVALINGTSSGTDPKTLFPTYGIAPLAGTGVTATVDATGLIVTLSAVTEGTAGNALTLSESTSNMTASATFTNATADHASGLLTFGGVSVNTQTVTINGAVVTFTTAPWDTTAATAQVGGTATASAQNLKATINAFPGTFGCTAAGLGATLALTALAEGAAGNLVTLAHSNTVPTLSGTTLTGGATAEADSYQRPYAIAAQPCAAATPGVSIPFFQGGVFNHEVLVWPASVATLAQRKRAVAGTGLYVGSLL